MPYETLVKEAHCLIDEIPREKIIYVIQILQGAKSLYSGGAEKADGGNILSLFDEAKVCVPITWTRDEINER